MIKKNDRPTLCLLHKVRRYTFSQQSTHIAITRCGCFYILTLLNCNELAVFCFVAVGHSLK